VSTVIDPVSIEDIFVAEARKQGVHPNSDAMRHVAIQLAGSTMAGSLIQIPGTGSISARDYVASIHRAMPEAFKSLHEIPVTSPTGNMTTDMRREIDATRSSKVLPDDWDEVRKRMNGRTAEMMDAVAARKGLSDDRVKPRRFWVLEEANAIRASTASLQERPISRSKALSRTTTRQHSRIALRTLRQNSKTRRTF
jgi:hypothetical protein